MSNNIQSYRVSLPLDFTLSPHFFIIFKISSNLTFCFLRALMNGRDRMPKSLKIMSLRASCRDSGYCAWSRLESRNYYNLFQNVGIHIRLQDSSKDKLIILGLIQTFLIVSNSGMNTAG